MLSGELVGRSALSGEIQKQVIAAGGGDAPIKSISVDGVEVEPDNKKNVNIDLSGKVDKTTEALKIYGTDSQGNQVQWIFRNTNNTKNTVAGRDSSGNIQVGTAVNSTDATNKQYVDDRFNGASKPISYDTYSEMITALNGMSATDLNRGQDIYIVQTGIPDVWVAYISETSVPYTYVDDDTFVNELLASGTVQVGYYKLGYLETQKVDLTEYVKTTDYATSEKAGVASFLETRGIAINSTGGAYISPASKTQIDAKATPYKPIVPTTIDYAVKKALADSKLIGDDAWTEDEKKSARALIGATNLNTHANYGVQNNASGLVMVVKATDDEITNKSTAYKPIVPTNLDFAIVQGLTNNSITLDDTQKSAIQTWLGLGDINTALETILGV